MKIKTALIYIWAIMLLVSCGVLPVLAVTADYRLGPGDQIDVSVWSDQGWQTKQLTIRPDGKLSLAVSLTRSEDYLLGAGDTLDVDVLGYDELQSREVVVREDGKIVLPVSTGNLTEYQLKPGDVLSIGVYRISDLQVKEITIRPDGKISFPLLGEITASENSVNELCQNITEKLAKYVKNPQVNVDVVKFHRIPAVKEFQAAGMSLSELRTQLVATIAETVQNPQVTVKIAKYRPIPLVQEISAGGLTLDELTKRLNHVFSEYIKNPKIAVNITKFRTLRVYVLGEVAKPGIVEIEKSHNLLDALGMAGGHTRKAAKSSIYVVHQATGECQKLSFNELIKKADLSQNVELAEGNVVYLADNKLNFIEDILPYITAVYQIRNM